MVKNISSLVAIILIALLINHNNWEWGDRILRSVFLFSISYLIIKEVAVLLRFIGSYMFNLRTDYFDKKIERPRLLVYLTFGTASIILFILYWRLDKSIFLNQYYISTIILVPLIPCIYFLNFTWDDRFYETFVEKVQKRILLREHKSYELNWNDRQSLELIYTKLYDNDFIGLIHSKEGLIDKTLFSEILVSGKTPEKPVFKLNMDNIQTKHFYDLISKNSKNFTLDEFLKIFKNKNEKATRNSIEVSSSKATSLPKMKEEIAKCFFLQ